MSVVNVAGMHRRCIELFLLVWAVSVITTILRLQRIQWEFGRPFQSSESFDDDPADRSSLPLVAIVSCIKSSGHDPAFALETYLLPSIRDTITDEERKSYRVELILGYDEGDRFWQHRSNQLAAVENDRRILDARRAIPVSFLSIRKHRRTKQHNSSEVSDRIPFNELCQAAYDYGASYIVRVNDDSRFLTPGWISLSVRALRSYDPPNVGVVGPTCREGNADILTHDMVHAPSHYAVFDTYYPEVFDNYYVDDWMTRVYGEERTTVLKDWQVMHHLYTYGTRYRPSFGQDKYLNDTVQEGRKRIESFLLRKNTEWGEDRGEGRRVLGTDALERVDGPMERLHSTLLRREVG